MKKLLFILMLFIGNFIFGQFGPPSTCVITRTTPNPTESCSTVNFHVRATNNLSVAQLMTIEVFTPGISQISSSRSFTSSLISGITHFTFDLSPVMASGSPGSIVTFDFSFKIDCSVIPNDLSLPGGAYTTSSILRSQPYFIGATPFTQPLPNISTSYDWVNLYYTPYTSNFRINPI